MKAILMTSSALLLVSGLGAAQAQDDACPAEIDAFTRDYEEAMAAFDSGEALSASEQSELFGLRTTAETAHRAGKQELCLDAIDRARLMLETAIAPTAIDPRELVGMDVRNGADESLGEVDGVTLDPMSGRIAYVLVEHGGFLGIGDSLFPVPWRAVTWAPGAEALLLDVDEAQLENAPRYLDEEVTPQERRAWLLSVHSYYGVEPYWQDNFPSLALGAGAAGGTAAAGAALAGDSGTDGAATDGAATDGAGTDGAVAVTVGGAETAEPAGSDEDAAVVVVEPEPATGGAGAGAAASDGAAQAEGESAAMQVAGSGEGQAAGDAGALDAVMARIDELEGRIGELSQQGVGEEVRQAVADLQAQVQELAQQAPGEEIRAAVADLQAQVQQLSEQAPGEEVRSAVAELQERVQDLARSEPAQEMRDAMARMQAEIRQLASGAGAGSAAGSASGGSGGAQAGGTAASAFVDSGSTGRVIVIEPEDVQVIEPGDAATGETEQAAASGGQGGAAQDEAGDTTAGQDGGTEAATAGQGGAAEAASSGQGGDAETAAQAQDDSGMATAGAPAQGGAAAAPSGGETAAGETAGQAAAAGGQAQDGTASAGGEQTAAIPASESDLASPETAGGDAQALAGVEPCGDSISRLEEDLARAEQMGLTVREAQNELKSAQAMLNRDSQALCRAAIKRARDELVAQGFQPAQAD